LIFVLPIKHRPKTISAQIEQLQGCPGSGQLKLGDFVRGGNFRSFGISLATFRKAATVSTTGCQGP
jgi:hypothetical protein